MKIAKHDAPARSRGWALAAGAAALALAASPAAAATAGDLVVWPREVEEGYARPLHLMTDMRIDRAGLTWAQVDGPSVPVRELGGGHAVADLSGLDVARDVELVFAVTNGVQRASAGVVVRAADDRPAAASTAWMPGRTKPGGVDALPREQRKALPPVATPGGTDLLPDGKHGDVLVPGVVTPGGVDTMADRRRARRPRPVGVALGVRSPDATPGGTDLLPGDGHGDVLVPGVFTPGGTDLLPGGKHGDVLKPGVVTPGGVDTMADRRRARRPRPVGVVLGVRSPDATPGGTDLLPGDGHGDVLVPGVVTPGGTDLLPGGKHGDVLVPGVVTPGGVDKLADIQRGHRSRRVPAGAGVRSPEATPGGTDLLPGGEHGDVLVPGVVTPGGVDLLPARRAARRDPFQDGSLQRWTAFATYPYAGLDIVAFNVANRFALTTLTTYPAPLSWLDLSGFVRDIELATFAGTRYALVAMGTEGIAVVDVDDPAQPVLVAEVRVSYGAEGVSFAAGADAPATVDALVTDGATLWIGDADYGLQSTALERLLGPPGVFR